MILMSFVIDNFEAFVFCLVNVSLKFLLLQVETFLVKCLVGIVILRFIILRLFYFFVLCLCISISILNSITKKTDQSYICRICKSIKLKCIFLEITCTTRIGVKFINCNQGEHAGDMFDIETITYGQLTCLKYLKQDQ